MKKLALATAIVAVALGTLATPALAGDTSQPVIVLNGQGNDLDAYTGNEPFKHQLVIQNHNDDPNGRDINAQICFFPDGKTFIAGEDTGQPDPLQGWGIFKMKGTKVGKLRGTRSAASPHDASASSRRRIRAATTTPRTTAAGSSLMVGS